MLNDAAINISRIILSPDLLICSLRLKYEVPLRVENFDENPALWFKLTII